MSKAPTFQLVDQSIRREFLRSLTKKTRRIIIPPTRLSRHLIRIHLAFIKHKMSSHRYFRLLSATSPKTSRVMQVTSVRCEDKQFRQPTKNVLCQTKVSTRILLESKERRSVVAATHQLQIFNHCSPTECQIRLNRKLQYLPLLAFRTQARVKIRTVSYW